MVLNKEDYNKELNRLISGKDTYEKLKGNPTKKLKAKLTRLTKGATKEGIINKKRGPLFDTS